MGKDYWYWSGSKSNKSSKKGGDGGGKVETSDNIPSGCMCAVFQAFDFHPFHFSLHHQQQQQQQKPSSFNNSSSHHNILHTLPKGAEAPRNSLESEDGIVSSNSLDEKLKIPKNIRIKTSGGSTRAKGGGNVSSDVSSELISSPGTKTPTLVARLMGLDLLPDALNSSSSSSSSCISTPSQQHLPHHHHIHHHLRLRQHNFQLTKHRNSTGSYNNNNNNASLGTPTSSDFEHRRLSLQINKENLEREDMDLPRFSSTFSKRKCNNNDENFNSRSPSHYARQIVKQVKESVSRKVGVDITNTIKSREKEREEFVTQLRLKKSLNKSSSMKSSSQQLDESNSSPGKHSNSSYSPRLSRFMDTKHKPSTTTKPTSPLITQKDENTSPNQPSPKSLVNIEAQASRVVLTKAKPQALLQDKKAVCKKNNNTNVKFSSRIMNKPHQQKTSSIIRKKQEEAFVILPSPSAQVRGNDIKTKNKRTHHHPLPTTNVLINNIINTSMVPILLPIKMDPSPLATKIPQKQVGETRSTQLSSCSSQRYKQQALSHTLSSTLGTTNDHNNKSNGVSTTDSPEFQYIATILSRTPGPHNNNFQWFSASHPLDPSIFHKLELYPSCNSTLSYPENHKDCNFTQNNHLGPRCNRRLLFDLVDEVLLEILVMKKTKYDDDVNGMLLLERVWKKVLSFPRAKCEVLEDIDMLIEINEEKEENERENELVVEIEEKILDTLVHETVTVMVGATTL